MPADPSHWRLVLGDGRGLQPAGGPANMAIDSALLHSVRDGGAPVLRLYRWSPACLSFGRNQPARGLYDREAAAGRGIGFVRRPTGGQAVLHDDELTYAVIAPIATIGRPRAAYRRINEGLVAALRSLGVPAHVAGGEAAGAAPSWSEACFGRPASGEVVVAGRKLVGSAQRAEAGVILQHGSLLVAGSQSAAEDLLVAGARPAVAAAEARPGWTTLATELSARPSWDSLVSAVAEGFEGALGISLAPSALLAAEAADAARLRERFRSDDWTWRR